MRLYVFAGPNGSGKSTMIKGFFDDPKNSEVEYICPDEIAKSLEGTFPDINERYLAAMQKAEKLRYEAIEKKIPLCVETVLSTQEKIDFILAAKNAGYKVHIVYVTTASPQINIYRIANRVSQGGHAVPEEKIISRYYKSLQFLPELIRIADEMLIYDNSNNYRPILVFADYLNQRYIKKRYMKQDWFKKYVKPYI